MDKMDDASAVAPAKETSAMIEGDDVTKESAKNTPFSSLKIAASLVDVDNVSVSCASPPWHANKVSSHCSFFLQSANRNKLVFKFWASRTQKGQQVYLDMKEWAPALTLKAAEGEFVADRSRKFLCHDFLVGSFPGGEPELRRTWASFVSSLPGMLNCELAASADLSDGSAFKNWLNKKDERQKGMSKDPDAVAAAWLQESTPKALGGFASSASPPASDLTPLSDIRAGLPFAAVLNRAAYGFECLASFVDARNIAPFSTEEISAARNLLQASHLLEHALQRRLRPDLSTASGLPDNCSSQKHRHSSASAHRAFPDVMSVNPVLLRHKRLRSYSEAGAAAQLHSRPATSSVALEGGVARPADQGA